MSAHGSNPPTPPPKTPPPAGTGVGPNRHGANNGDGNTGAGVGYRRSPSITAAVDFFEGKSRSTSSSDIRSTSNSPRPSISSNRSTSFSARQSPASTPGPSRPRDSSNSSRKTPTKASASHTRNVASPQSHGGGEESWSPRTSIDSTASTANSGSSRTTPVGLGMRGVGSIASGRELRRTSEGSPKVAVGSRRVSDTAAIAETSPAGPSRKTQGPRPSLPSSGLASPVTRRTSSPVTPSKGGSPSSVTRPSRTTPRTIPSSRLHPSPDVPSPRTNPTSNSPRTLSSPQLENTSTIPHTPSGPRKSSLSSPRQPQQSSPRTPSSIPRPNRAFPSPRGTPADAPGISVSHPTPDRSGSSSRSKRPTDPRTPTKNGSSSQSGRPSDSSRSAYQRSSAAMEPSHSTSSRSSTNSHSRYDGSNDVVVLDSEDEQDGRRSPAGSIARPDRPPLEIPRRTSSATSSALPSPTNSIQGFGKPPVISPRKSSKSSLTPVDQLADPFDSSPSSSRRASKSIMLGNVYQQNVPGSPERTRLPSISQGVSSPPSASTSPRPDRKSPGLKIETPTLPFTRTLAAKPSPPIPAKNPLRSMSRQSSASYMAPLSAASVDSPKDSDSTTAVAGTPITPAEPSPRPERPNRRVSVATVFADTDENDTIEVDESRLQSLQPDSKHMGGDEIRFTMLTQASAYSQDSAPPSATSPSWESQAQPSDAEELHEHVVNGVRRRSRMDDLWGKMRDVKTSDEGHEDQSALRVTLPDDLQHVPTDSPITANTATTATSTLASGISNNASTGHHSPVAVPLTPNDHKHDHDPTPHRREPIRSPSAPHLNRSAGPATPSKASRLLGIEQLHPVRSGTEPTPLLPSAMTRSPTAPTLTPRTPSSSSNMSKRSHLIREIATTERAYATDLALVRDAYLGRYLRPTSTSSGESTFPGSRRGSTTPHSDSKRFSGTDWVTVPGPGPGSFPLARSPSEINAGPYGYFTPSMTASASTTSTVTNSVTSFTVPSPGGPAPKGPTTPGSGTNGMMPPPVGKPLAPHDVKAVFLNIDQLAAGADELATAFEQAMGDDDNMRDGREGEIGTDRLGEVFAALIPRLRPVYHYYCARQHTASQRLQELLQDSAHSVHLHGCWSRIKNHTHAWNLDSMLIKPVQRITKYPLLFEDLLGCTTPVHPDYFNIRNAAELAKSIAIEIDEAKRRKEVVANALNRNGPGPSPVKPAGKGLKLFRKDKEKGSTISLPTSSSMTTLSSIGETGHVPEISRNSFITLKALAERVEEAEQVVRRVGKEIVLWTAGAKEILLAEDGLCATWARVVRLEESDQPADRVQAFREVLNTVVREVWANLNEEVKESIMPVFAKLLDASVNPRKVIHKRESRYTDYTRYLQLVKAKKHIDKSLSLSARDFYALHIQLIDELPVFLEGYSRILDLALMAFASAQARYHLGVKTALDEFSRRWIARPRKGPRSPKYQMDGQLPEGVEEEADLGSGRGIVKAWHSAWVPYADAMDHFQCTKPARAVASRLASFNTRPGSRPSSRPSSPAPVLHHSNSFTSHRPASTLSPSRTRDPPKPTTTANRTRSTSLLGPAPQIVSPTKESSSSGRFGVNLLRSSSRTPRSYHSTPRSSRPASLHIPQSGGGGIGGSNDNTNRYSFGLPKIPNDTQVFEGLGLSPTRSATAGSSASRATSDTMRYDLAGSPLKNGGSSAMDLAAPEARAEQRKADVEGLGLGLGEIQRKSLAERSEKSGSGTSGRSERATSVATSISHDLSSAPTSRKASAADAAERRSGKVDYSVDASEGWRNEPVLYQCACVAEFDPLLVGNKRYRGLKFLPMIAGDLFDIFHEVGRIDELPSFPYPEIGVDNDGVLVGRGEDGGIGLLICSFLEPLRV